jgi:cobalt-zinc-cadmium efflux system outer membrane protein
MNFSNITKALLIVTIAFTTIATPPAHAQDPPRTALNLSVDQAITQALDHNRQLRVAALEIDKARSRLRWSGRLNNPTLDLEGSNDQWGNNEGEGAYEIAFSQSFPLTSRLKDQKALRRVQVILAEAELAEARRSLAKNVAQNAITLLSAHEQNDLLEKLKSLNNEIVAFLKTGADAGEVSPLDLTQARLNSAALARRISAIRIRSIDLEKSLKKLLSLQPTQPLTLKDPPPLPPSPPARFMDSGPIFKQRPDYAIALIQNDAARAEQALAHSERWEDVALKLFAEREQSLDEPIGLDRNNLFGIGISIPLPFWKKNREAIDAANIDLEATRQKIAARELFIRLELASALEKRHATYELAEEASGETLQLANENLEAFRAAYENGQATLLQLQRAQEQQLELQTAALELTADYHLAQAEVRYVTADYPGLQTPAPGTNTSPTSSK